MLSNIIYCGIAMQSSAFATFFWISFFLLFASSIQPNAATAQDDESIRKVGQLQPEPNAISNFIRRIYHANNGDLWLGTNGNGVARHSEKGLEYFSQKKGFAGLAVRAIAEDSNNNIWFGTEKGVSRFDGNSFTNFTQQDGLPHDDVWCLEIDKKGKLWVGTFQGVCVFDGTTFRKFDLPESESDPFRGVSSKRIVHSIMQDSKGRMWFGNNSGAWIWDGKSLKNLSEDDGLCNNAVNDILEDRDGNFWFATHHNGVCRWDRETFVHFSSSDGVKGTEAWSLFEDKAGNIWFPIENAGLYRFNGESIDNFHAKEGLLTNAVQCIHEDRGRNLWIGGWRGLFRMRGESIVPVTKNGPWK